jgi:hypothetical protein
MEKKQSSFYAQLKSVLQANESVLTLGGTVRSLGNKEGEPTKSNSISFATKANPFQTPREDNFETEFGVQHKPMNLARHKNSDYASYLMSHAKPAINAVARPFQTDEAGRMKSTEVLDHIIKTKKDRDRSKVALKSKL